MLIWSPVQIISLLKFSTMTSPKGINSKVGYTINNVYYLTKILGSGASGTVYHAIHQFTNEEFAIKMVSKVQESNHHTRSTSTSQANSMFIKARHIPISPNTSYDIYGSHLSQALYKEVILHSAVHSHSNILSIIEVLDSEEYFSVVMEYCELGDLLTALTERNWYIGNEVVVKELFSQLLDAVEYCHSRSVFHCDLKPENILVEENGNRLKLADFGLASISPFCTGFGRGSSYYMSPENISDNLMYRKKSDKPKSRRIADIALGAKHNTTVLQSKGYPKASSDIWALGIIFLNLLFGRNPWKTASISTDLAYEDYTNDFNSLKTIMPVSDELNIIMSLVFHPDPYRRLSISQFRQKIMACPNLINTQKQFAWFNPQSTITTADVDNSSLNQDMSSLLSEVTHVHIENLKDHSVDVTSVQVFRPVFSQRKVKGSSDANEDYISVHSPPVFSPPTSVSSMQFSDCTTSSTFNSEESVLTCVSASSSSHRKRKINEDMQLVEEIQPSASKKAFPSSGIKTTSDFFYSTSSVYNLCNDDSGNSKRLRSECLLSLGL